MSSHYCRQCSVPCSNIGIQDKQLVVWLLKLSLPSLMTDRWWVPADTRMRKLAIKSRYEVQKSILYLISECGIVFIDVERLLPLALAESEPQDMIRSILAVDLSSAFAADVWAGSSVGFGPLLIWIALGLVWNTIFLIFTTPL